MKQRVRARARMSSRRALIDAVDSPASSSPAGDEGEVATRLPGMRCTDRDAINIRSYWRYLSGFTFTRIVY